MRDEEGNVLDSRESSASRSKNVNDQVDHCDPPLRPERDRDIVDATAFALSIDEWKSRRKQELSHVGEKVMGIPTSRIMSDSRLNSYGGARNEGMTIGVDVSGFDVEKFKAKGSVERMAVLRQRPTVQLETDSCGRYHFSKAIMYREVETKRNGTYREQIIGYGVARRQHGDPKDTYVGEGLAVSRALEDLGFKVGRRSWGKVKHNDDIKVQRRQQKERRREIARESLAEFAKRSLRQVCRLT